MIKFTDIEKLPIPVYAVDVTLEYVKDHLDKWNSGKTTLILNPDFQRGHVWSQEQKEKYIEYLMTGGKSGRDFFFNCSSWMGKFNTPIVCVDGLQRLTAITEFMDNKVKAHGQYHDDYEDIWKFTKDMVVSLRFHVAKLQTKEEILNWYIQMNTGGTPHTKEEINRVKEMLK